MLCVISVVYKWGFNYLLTVYIFFKYKQIDGKVFNLRLKFILFSVCPTEGTQPKQEEGDQRVERHRVSTLSEWSILKFTQNYRFRWSVGSVD